MNLRPAIQSIREAIERYAALKFSSEFIPGETYLPATGKMVDGSDLWAIVRSALDMNLTAGVYAEELESALTRRCGVKKSLLVNSGSSAGLLALSTLCEEGCDTDRPPLRAGDEVITAALAFPTTVNPIVQMGAVPVFVDVDPETLNPSLASLQNAVTEKTRAVVLAHTLGNPLAIGPIAKWCRENRLYLVEDACDGLGARYQGEPIGSFGDMATLSFYPSHQITMGEGGAVLTSSSQKARIAECLRDWGRDCWCAPGTDNTCGRRFDWNFENLPEGYDHKYVYSRLGYNLKVTDLQAALGLSQLNKLENFISRRRANWRRLAEGIQSNPVLKDRLALARSEPDAEPCWFGFVLRVREGISRARIVRQLEENKVGTRPILAGNLTRQPAYRKVNYRISGDLIATDSILNDGFWIGLQPSLTDAALDYMLDCLGRAAVTQ